MPLKNNKQSTVSRLLNDRKFLRGSIFVLSFGLVGSLFLLITSAAPTPGFYGSVERDQMSRINARRSSLGRAGVNHIECLNQVAENWTKTMADARNIWHNPNRSAQIQNLCGGYWTVNTENVGVGGSSESLFSAFVASAAHRANIDDGRVTRSGIGAYWGTDGRLYITQIFAHCSNCSGGWNTNVTYPNDPVAPTPVTYTTKAGSTIQIGESLTKGTMVYSPQKKFYLVMQGDGNLVLYNNSTKQAVWNARTAPYGKHAVMQSDGNFVVYKSNGTACSSRTGGKGGKYMAVQDDGNFVQYNGSNQAVWSSRYNSWYC